MKTSKRAVVLLALSLAFVAPLGAETIGFWSFAEGAPGTDVETVSSSGGTTVFHGTASKIETTGKMPTFSSDTPLGGGGAVLISSLRDRTPVSTGVIQSVDFRYTSRTVRQGGYIDIAGLTDALVGKGSFTIEYFIKMDESYTYWQEGDGSYDNRSKTMLYLEAQKNVGGFKTIAPNDVFQAGEEAGKARGLALQVYTRKEEGVPGGDPVSTWNVVDDGRWHHFALVYKETNAVNQSGTIACYVDYACVGDSLVYRNGSSSESGLKFRLGSGYKDAAGVDKTWTESVNASISCLRVSSGALGLEDFERVSQTGGTTIFAIGFNDDVAAQDVLFAPNCYTDLSVSLSSDFGCTLSTSFAYGLHPETFPRYDMRARRVGLDVLWGTSAVWKNRAAGHFLGYSSLTNDTPWRIYAGTEMVVWTGSNPLSHVTNPESWTMEAFVKVEYDQWINYDYGALLFGKYTHGSHPSGDENIFPQFCWMLTRMPNGKLRISWTEVTEDKTYTAANKASFECFAETDGDCLGKRWHHVALSYDKPTRTFKLYVDYSLVKTATVSARGLLDRQHGYYFSRMMATSGFEGWMDEIRFSWGALAPEAFVRFAPSGGLLFIR